MSGSRPIVLLVEDNPADATMLTTLFEMQGFDGALHWVKDGEEALDFLLRRGEHREAPTPHLVLLDLNLPRVPGLDVLRAVRKSPLAQDTRVVVLTTSSSEPDRKASAELGAAAFLTKPPDLDEYEKLVRRILDVELVPRKA
jgi:DNA-binding response OmpR family regulator